jgi:hypothetical protein
MSSGEIPKVEYLNSIQADNAGECADVLVYDDLYRDAKRNAALEGRRIDAFYEQEPGSIEELAKARQLAFAYWVAMADKVVESGPHSRDLWAQRYTNASVELFGAPEHGAVIREIAHQKSTFENMIGDERVDQNQLNIILEAYAPIVESAPESAIEEADRTIEADYELALSSVRELIYQRYGQVLGLVEASGKSMFTQPELVELFTQALGTLAKVDDGAWADWKVVTMHKGTAISVHGQNREIRIPANRAPVDAAEAKKLLGHELLTHALRPENGRNSSDERMLKGFPGYLDGEEGLAILMGAAASDGKVADAIHDRYIDIALAMGTVGDAPKNRDKLFELVFARRLVRAQHNGEEPGIADIQKSTSKYVDRIFRGSPGDAIGTEQAVYTADVYYYNYKKIAGFIATNLRRGTSMNTIFDYLMQGKFDPLDPMHRQRVGSLMEPPREENQAG